MRQVNKIICLIKRTTSDGNSELLNYLSADWRIPLFINIELPSNPDDDINEICNKLAARLDVPAKAITLEFDRSDPMMKTSTVKKTKDSEKAVIYGPEAEYNFFYAVIKFVERPSHLFEKSFTVNRVEYKWMTLNDLKMDDKIRESNNDVVSFISKRFDATLIKLDNALPNLIFVISAFLDDMEPIFKGIQAAGQAYGTVARVKDVLGDYRITDKIIEMIQQAHVIIADLSHERPNVYFELGYARGIKKTVITIARECTPLHFDVKDWTCTFYNDSRDLEEKLRKRLAHEFNQSA